MDIVEYDCIGKVSGIIQGHLYLFRNYSVCMLWTIDDRCILFGSPQSFDHFMVKNHLVFEPIGIDVKKLFSSILKGEQP